VLRRPRTVLLNNEEYRRGGGPQHAAARVVGEVEDQERIARVVVEAGVQVGKIPRQVKRT
jgi:hypothetical protein